MNNTLLLKSKLRTEVKHYFMPQIPFYMIGKIQGAPITPMNIVKLSTLNKRE